MGLEEHIEAVCKICGRRFNRPRGLFSDIQLCEQCRNGGKELIENHKNLLKGIGKL